MNDFAEKVADFLSQEKHLRNNFRWRFQRHDYSRAQAMVGCSESRLRGRVVLTAHASRIPPKYSFCLLFQNISIVRLDVAPGRSHTNFIKLTRERIIDTHWQFWPDNYAFIDRRKLSHHMWLDEFLRKCKITSLHRYVKPPFRPENYRFNFDVQHDAR